MKPTVLVVDDEQNMQAVMRMGEPGKWRRHLTCLRPASAGTRASRPGLLEGEAVSPGTAGTKQSVYR
jgi:hypothetical protein